MKLLFPRSAMMKKLPDPVFEHEFDAARSLGFDCLLFAEEVLSHEGAEQAVKVLPDGDGGPLLYRGWILTEEEYGAFDRALAARGHRLVSTPAQYAEVTYFPNYYPKVRGASPAAVWTDTPDTFLAWSRSRSLGDGPFVLKDHVKSAKHLWHEACFVPKGAGRERFESIAGALLNEQGKSFHRGFVVKQYVPLRSRGTGPREYPLCEEYRLFFWRGELLTASHYHDRTADRQDWSPFVELAGRFDAPFFTMDVAEAEGGTWLVVDMGAGECSSLPPGLPAAEFYGRLLDVLKAPTG
ncbi:MAG TPA: ATP-grasp domain-containing protein [Urbifossiella sp.]|nr:ATP-grasp domain-containing protein [Urbifossiella sp.]